MFEFSMTATINKPTRETSYTAIGIDNIITNFIFDNDQKGAIVKTDVSDHFPITFTTKLKTTSSPKHHVDQFIYKRDFKENSLNLFKQKPFETSCDSLKTQLTQMSRITSF